MQDKKHQTCSYHEGIVVKCIAEEIKMQRGEIDRRDCFAGQTIEKHRAYIQNQQSIVKLLRQQCTLLDVLMLLIAGEPF
jgi:hypothetical protein